jgi:hypothetical protein
MRKQRSPLPGSRYIAIQLAADQYGLPYHWLYTRVKNGTLRAMAEPKETIFIERASLEQLLDERTRGGKAA